MTTKGNRLDPFIKVRTRFRQSELDKMTLAMKLGPRDRNRAMTPKEYDTEVADLVRAFVLAKLDEKKR